MHFYRAAPRLAPAAARAAAATRDLERISVDRRQRSAPSRPRCGGPRLTTSLRRRGSGGAGATYAVLQRAGAALAWRLRAEVIAHLAAARALAAEAIAEPRGAVLPPG